MPGQTPAGTTPPPTPPTAAGADFITLAGRRIGHLTTVPEEAPMSGADPAPAAVPDDRLVIAIQSLYKARQMSLADPDTAAAYDVAMEGVILILDGTYRTGGLGEEEHHRLRALVDAARLVPNHLTGVHDL